MMEIHVGTIYSGPSLHTTLLPSSPLIVPTQALVLSAFQHSNTPQVPHISQTTENFNHLTPKSLCFGWYSDHDKAWWRGRFPRHCFRGDPRPSEMVHPHRQWQQSKIPGQTNKEKGIGSFPLLYVTLTYYFCWGCGEQKVVSLTQTTQNTYKRICVQLKGQAQLSIPFPHPISWNDKK